MWNPYERFKNNMSDASPHKARFFGLLQSRVAILRSAVCPVRMCHRAIMSADLAVSFVQLVGDFTPGYSYKQNKTKRRRVENPSVCGTFQF